MMLLVPWLPCSSVASPPVILSGTQPQLPTAQYPAMDISLLIGEMGLHKSDKHYWSLLALVYIHMWDL